MRCLFCKSESSNSRSVEHVVPESLGNHKLTLPPGVVCDSCNNYFSRKVEKPFLESGAISLMRFTQEVPSKRGRIPPIRGILLPGFPVTFYRAPGTGFAGILDVPPESLPHIFDDSADKLIVPASGAPPAALVLSRFLSKVALEMLAARLVEHPDGLEYLVDEAQLDPLRYHARRGELSVWPVSVRRIYEENTKWLDDAGRDVQLVHEEDILVTESGEWYFVLALFGMELAINYGGPEIDGYHNWLKQHGGVSPLYHGRNAVNPSARPIG